MHRQLIKTLFMAATIPPSLKINYTLLPYSCQPQYLSPFPHSLSINHTLPYSCQPQYLCLHSPTLSPLTTHYPTYVNHHTHVEALLFPFSLKPSTVSLPDSITLGSHNIPFSDPARKLGFILDSKLSMKKHIIKICQTAYFELKLISSNHRFLTEDTTKTLVTSYILSRLDYCNCILMGTPNSVIQPLQKIQNFAVRLVLLAPCHHHSTPLLEKLHWLPISECIKYKVACMCFSAVSGSGPAYLSELLHDYTPSHALHSSSDTCMLEIQQYKRKIHGFHTFSSFGPHIWN